MNQRIVEFSLGHRRWVFAGIATLCLVLGAFIPTAETDTDPENMLAADQPARVLNAETKARFALHDLLVVGVVDDKSEAGVFMPETLGALVELTDAIQQIDGVIEEDVLSLSTVDNVSSDGAGTVRFEWMLEGAPSSAEEASAIRDAARRLPMLDGSMVAETGAAVLIYVPVESKGVSHRVAGEVQAHIDALLPDEETFITGLPVAEDTFGVQMFIQMAICAPLAGLVIFLVMAFFFRSVRLVAAPMAVAMGTVITTMGLLVALGFKVHIMSSMIAIFLMPIAVVDSVHVLSEFADEYEDGKDPRDVIRGVMGHLFTPMLFTSLTSSAGFFSLLLTPIPPVQIFGTFVGFGILLAFLLTITFIPAYVAGMSRESLRVLADAVSTEDDASWLARALRGLGRWVGRNSALVVLGATAAALVSAWGISLIQINDNPVRWFRASQPIRVADAALNHHFAGTYPAYLVLDAPSADPGAQARAASDEALAAHAPHAEGVAAAIAEASAGLEGAADADAFFSALVDALYTRSDAAPAEQRDAWAAAIEAVEEAQIGSKTFQTPEVLEWMVGAQERLESLDVVGNAIALPDLVRTVYRELLGGDEEGFRIPARSRGVAQTIVSYQSSHRPNDLWHFVTPDYRSAVVWVQLKSGDNQDMSRVEATFGEWLDANPPPSGVEVKWTGPTYLNMVWQQEMVAGMGWSLLSAFGVVFLMMLLLFRSPVYGVLAMLPLSLTIAVIYGATGIVGKDYDMPLAVLSSLTLGLSVDFAIHLLQRVRDTHAKTGSWEATREALFEEPARAIARNAVVIAIGFLPLLTAPLVPYNTVGVLMAAIMIVSGAVTLGLLPSILGLARRQLFPERKPAGTDER